MSKVFVDGGISLDGFIAGPNARPGNPLGDGGTAIHAWMFRTAAFLERIGSRARGERSHDDGLVRHVFARTGAYVLGRRMSDEGELGWPEYASRRCCSAAACACSMASTRGALRSSRPRSADRRSPRTSRIASRGR